MQSCVDALQIDAIFSTKKGPLSIKPIFHSKLSEKRALY
jgi:hypothetical protein